VFLSEAKNAGHDVYGVDPSRYAINSARQRFGIDTIVEGTLQSIDPASIPQLDVFVMLASIEHLQDPAGALRFAREHLRPGGVLFLSTGVWGSFNQRIAGTTWGIILPKAHLYYFSKRTLRMALEKAGFEVVRLDTNSFLINTLTANRVLVRLFNNRIVNHLRIPLLVERFKLGDEMFILAKAR
jgi:SAM-dependent methyltransferase